MRVAFIEMAGFRGFREETRFEFPSGFVVLTGRNGAGKSTVLDALDFALTGTIDKYAVKSAKGGGLENHIWWIGEGAPRRQYVRVGFEADDGRAFEVTRDRDAGLSTPLSALAQELCVDHPVGDWIRTLVQTTLIRDETLAGLSLDLPEQERFQAVRAAIGGLTGPDHSQRTSEIVAVAKAAKAEQELKVEQLQQELGRTLSALTEARSVAERQPDVAEAEQAVKRLAPDLSAEGAELSSLLRQRIADRKQSVQMLIDAIERSAQLTDEVNILASSEVAEQRASLTARLLDLESEQARILVDQQFADTAYRAATDADAFASLLVGLLNHGEEIGLRDGHCPLCNAVRTNSEYEASIASARLRLAEQGQRLSTALAQLNAIRHSALEIQQEIKLVRSTLDEFAVRERQAKSELEKINETFTRQQFQAQATDSQLARQLLLKRQEDTAELEHALFLLESSSSYDRVSSLTARIEELRGAVDEEVLKVSAAHKAFEAARQIDSVAKTVANQMLTEQFDTVLPLLKELYQRLRPHTDWREIETDFGGKVRASLNLSVGDGMNPQFLFSSGQRRAAGLAFLLAIHLSRPWVKLKCLLLDDPIQHIDDYRALNVVEVLAAIRRAGRQVIVAVEDPGLADLLCRRLRSTTSEPGRRFDLSMSRNGSAAIERSNNVFPLPKKVLNFADAS
jgi:chromosome segregation protein